ncbi:metallo-beta-lactamase superfamily protein [Azonexus fungiphilus]|uniref:Metallo-beta-lactamase superfamily protein n=1 Tax=Azonexus fungiphilus TaxID=146940 RepID=A0A495WCB8_9RHOO|nr:MBL fold metallo-hydrolase [Azonexus fungiphilus]RKT59306.1 metallo-beta-lactamase superfamily protein [Azonexus fungiphilus]
MKKTSTIFQDGDHKWVAIVRDPARPGHLIDTNEYLVTHGGAGMLLDPGGAEVFPAVFSALSGEFDPSALRAIFASHQDPDICSSLALWLEFNPGMRCYVSWLWASFIPHFGGNAETFVAIPDTGIDIALDGLVLQAVPAHYLHSSGNFHLYDRQARILFSGDVGAALLPAGEEGLFVDDFDRHIRHAEGFHRRWMGSNEAKRSWCERVARMDIDMLCPQHGAIYRGADVQRFINWFDELRVGVLAN